MSTPIIRPIEKKDNQEIAEVIRTVLIEHGVPKVGTAYADKALDCMYETYDKERAIYMVVEEDGRLIGGAGIAQLDNYDGNVCELQKMYYLAEARGRGIGSQMMQQCLEKAKKFGFEKCYLETMPYMKAAQKLYERVGFSYIDGPMGDTGHFSCPVHMLKDL
ncbi:GNAT family N-acetyltransferase [Patiriisocius hiemis]|uniref:GNAT family N-acetyltransferase n=1 Tax=Patiriisocius hiemis TaxID=3075604 RepID=A0ABU2YAF8_9FLAO|nr:GNAT family N-acetyltransferase [Constantimarinum sp. W242]MDT0555169.1 GNAT family N-acetyltransferase [Constantimarinum sp. W242]